MMKITSIGILSRMILAVILPMAMAACTGVPDDVIQKEEMALLLADVHTGEAVVEANPSKFTGDSVKRAFKQSIFAEHGVTSDQVDHSLRWYGNHMDKYVEVYDRVIEILDSRMQAAEQQSGVAGTQQNSYGQMLALEGDSVDVWNQVRFRPFGHGVPSDQLAFIFNYDPNWERGDVYTLRSKLIGNSRQGHFTVSVDYSDGSSEQFSQTMIGEGWHDISFALDSTRSAREIYGTISYDAAPKEKAYIDSITFTRTRWNAGRKALRKAMKHMRGKSYSKAYD